MKKMLFLAAVAAIVLSACSSPKPQKTIENLKSAITGEANASAKYAAFGKRATQEGYNNIAVMFAAASEAEARHVVNHQKVLTSLGEPEFTPIIEAIAVDTTPLNLEAAIEGETYEFDVMYPDFIAAANEEKAKDAITSFQWAMDAEKDHAVMYNETLNSLTANGNDTQVSSIWYICPKCGDLFSNVNTPEVCPLCANSKSNYQTFQ